MSTTVYTGRVTNWSSIVLSGLLMVPLIGSSLPGTDPDLATVMVTLTLLGILVEVVTASDVRATCGSQGVSVHWGFLGWPRAQYPLDEIQDAWVVDIPSWRSVSYGFWWTPSRTVCTVRTGPALRLQLLNGRTVTVTAPDPHAAVAALRDNGLDLG